MKKLLSIVLALVMTLGLCAIPVWGDGEPATTATPTYDWYTPDATEYILDSMSDYLGFVKLTQGAVTEADTTGVTNFKNKTVKLQCDVDFEGMDFYKTNASGSTAINWRVGTFKGTFNAKDDVTGENHTIKNLTYTVTGGSGSYGMGVFRNVYGTIQNLNVENITVSSDTAVSFGGVAVSCGKDSSLPVVGLYNCHVSNIDLTLTCASNGGYIGGLAGMVGDYKEVKNCSVTDFTLSAPNTMVNYVGGLIGDFYISNADNKVGALDSCHVNGFKVNVAGLSGMNTAPGGMGGMLGAGYDGNDNYAFPITDCTVKGANITVGTMSEHSYIGGFMGMSRRRYAATNCSAEGTITVNGTADGAANCYVGGFCGASTGAARNGGGWAQDSNGAALSFTDCSARVDITAGGVCTVGGFAGLAGDMIDTGVGDYAKFINCTSGGTLTTTGTGTVGGFAGKDTDRGTYVACGNGGTASDGSELDSIGTRTTPFTDANSLTVDMPTQELSGGVNPYQVFSAPVDTSTMNSLSIDLAKTAFHPTRAGYIFKGWSNSEGGAPITDDAIPVTLGGENTTIYYALWEKIPEATPPADQIEPEPDEEPVASGHTPIRRQHGTAAEDTAETTTDTTIDTTKTEVVTSAKTFDAGVAVYGVMAVMSLTGSAWVMGKKRG